MFGGGLLRTLCVLNAEKLANEVYSVGSSIGKRGSVGGIARRRVHFLNAAVRFSVRRCCFH